MKLLLAIAIVTLVFAAPAAACPKTTLPEIENDVMCPICGTTLGNSGGPQSQREREFIRSRVERCQSEAEIKRALVAEYGEQVLARPRRQGFQVTAYVVPAVTAVFAALALLAGVARWRRAPRPVVSGPASQSDLDRIDDDLRNYDL